MANLTQTLRYNYRLYPTPGQEEKLVEFGSYARGLWNLLLAENQRRYSYDKTFLFYSDMAKLIFDLKKFDEFAWLKAFDSAAAQQVAKDLDQALHNGIRKDRIQRFPKFKLSYKKKKLHNDSYRAVNNSNCIRIKNGKISLPKVGHVPIRYHRNLPSKFTLVTVTYHHGIWEASIVVKVEKQAPKESLNSIAGFDINSVHTLVSSNGWYVTNPKSLKNNETKLKELQRKLSRQKKGSNRWKNTKQRLQKVHFRIRRQRQDFGHQVSNTIAKCFDLAVFEDLNVRAMQQWNGRMTGDNLMGEIVNLTRYKMDRSGGLTHNINRFAASTKVCSSCHHTQIMGLNDRVFNCQACNYIDCRDWNSAKNIAEIGVKELSQAGTVCWASPTSQVKSTVKTKVRTLVRLDVGSAKRDAA
jgi:putative transposase